LEYSKVLIDTSIIIEYLRKTHKEKTLFWKIINSYDCYISSVTVFELYSGAKEPSHHQALNTVLSYLNIIEFDEEQAKIASSIFQKLKAKNKLIEFRDIFIASSAVNAQIPLATLNKKHFKRIDNIILLVIEDK